MSKTITFRTSEDIYDRIGELAKSRGVPKTRVIHQALVEHFAVQEVPVPVLGSVSMPTAPGTFISGALTCTHSYVQTGHCLVCGKAA